jgi:hypothetical protein
MKDKKFYIQDTRDYIGNDIAWWRDGGGYTANLAEAEVFTHAEALEVSNNRKTDRMWPKEYIDGKAIRVIDMQLVSYREAMGESTAKV